MLPRVLAIAATLAFLASPVPADEAPAEPSRPTIYKWVDTNGIAHYTTDPDRIPDSLRGRLRRLGGPGDTTREPPTPRDVAAEQPAAVEEAGEPAPGPRRPRDSDWWAVRDAGEADDFGPGDPYAPFDEGGPEPAAAQEQRAQTLASLDEQMVSLRAEISRDEEFLKTRISDAALADPLTLADDPEFREVARRLPRLQADLRALVEERERLEEP